jgi:hypothetical protein
LQDEKITDISGTAGNKFEFRGVHLGRKLTDSRRGLPVVVGAVPGFVWVVAFHRRGSFCGIRSEVLLVHDSVVADDEATRKESPPALESYWILDSNA